MFTAILKPGAAGRVDDLHYLRRAVRNECAIGTHALSQRAHSATLRGTGGPVITDGDIAAMQDAGMFELACGSIVVAPGVRQRVRRRRRYLRRREVFSPSFNPRDDGSKPPHLDVFPDGPSRHRQQHDHNGDCQPPDRRPHTARYIVAHERRSHYLLSKWAALAMAELHAADATLAVERYRRAQRRLPSTLDELVPAYLPEVPVDPFSGGPLKYVLREGSATIYSVGENRTDERGSAELWRVESEGPTRKDIGFTIGLR